MWINAFNADSKNISPVELLVLTEVPTERYSNATEISGSLKDQSKFWEPTPGVLYPILHRLEKLGFLEKKRERPIQFRRVDKGNIFLSSILKPLLFQVQETQTYFLNLYSAVLDLEPVPSGLHEFFDDIESWASSYLNRVKELRTEAQKLEDKTYHVPVDFE